MVYNRSYPAVTLVHRPHSHHKMKTLLILLLLAIGGQSSTTCQGRCGVNDGSGSCQCNSLCDSFGDCCSDYEEVCLSCTDRCGEAFSNPKPCQCNDDCISHNNCCSDYQEVCTYSCKGRCGEAFNEPLPCQCNDECSSHSNCCSDYDDYCSTGGEVTDDQLRDLTEQLFAADVNSVLTQLTLDYQGQGGSGDQADGPLFVSVPDSALAGPTISKLLPLLDNYLPPVTQTEAVTEGEGAEEDAFLDAVADTQVMALAESFLQDKGLLSGSLKIKLKELWFTLYTRSGSTVGSSGFEHVFVGEIKNGDVSGFHDWVNFQKEEREGNLNYEGYTQVVYLGDKAELMENHFVWLTEPKEFGTMFIGASPELELATYTVCFLARPDQLCPVQMDGYRFQIQSWIQEYNGKELVGTAYPVL